MKRMIGKRRFYIISEQPIKMVDLHNARNYLSEDEYKIITGFRFNNSNLELVFKILDTLIDKKLGASKRYLKLTSSPNSKLTYKRVTPKLLLNDSIIINLNFSSECGDEYINKYFKDSSIKNIIEERKFIKKFFELLIEKFSITSDITNVDVFSTIYLTLKKGLIKA